MGQQQLILLVLATVIVGLAIIVGIRAFNENSIKSNSDAVIQDMVRIASDAQAWKQKPAPFGGQAEGAAKQAVANYTGANLTDLGYQESGGTYSNLNGDFRIAASAANLTICGYNALKGNSAEIVVTGISDTTITSQNVILGTATAMPAACP